MSKLAGRWVEIVKKGKYLDSEGVPRDIDDNFLNNVVANYNASDHEAPAVIGHPVDNGPAHGWVKALRLNSDGLLEAQFGEVDAGFEQMLRDGRYKKRSASFYLDPPTAPGGRAPYLRHVGFLGAQPPAVKGLRDIQFGEGDALTFEIQSIQFSEEQQMDEKDFNRLSESLWDRLAARFGIGKKEGAQASFTEADLTNQIKAALEPVTTSFNEKLAALQTQNSELLTRIGEQTAKTSRSELKQFVDSLGQARLPEALRPGLVDFLEGLPDSGDRKVTIVEFSEVGGNKVETKTEMSPRAFMQKFLSSLPSFIQFGEHFNALPDAGSPTREADKAEVQNLRSKSDVPVKEGK
jgi:hypothetical protein